MRINYKRSQLGMLGAVLLLMAVSLYMALAGPYTLFHLKQSETSEIKTVIVVARHGDEWPSREAYFLGPESGQQQQASQQSFGPPGQLTNVGKERMYLLGKFLRMRYYERLLAGDPRRLSLRSADSDKCLESAQLLAAGLNPPQSQWVWSRGSVDQELAGRWQPHAVHSTEERRDDLLSSRSKCLLDYESNRRLAGAWKESSKYTQLLTEFRHDLQMLRQNTGLEFEDDLEMLVSIDEHLKARLALGEAPSWYSSTVAQRLAHIADVTSGCKFGERDTQRLYAGRLLDVIARTIFEKIHPASVGGLTVALNEDEDELDALKTSELGRATRNARPTNNNTDSGPKVNVLMTDKQHLTGLLNALKIYSTQPHYGFLLIIELHFDPSIQVHFLRLFTVNSQSHNVFPEPVRVNPIACPLDSVECSPQQFEQNIRHLSVDKTTWWHQLCNNLNSSGAHSDQQTVPPALTTLKPVDYEKLDESLLVGPIDLRPPSGALPSSPSDTDTPTSAWPSATMTNETSAETSTAAARPSSETSASTATSDSPAVERQDSTTITLESSTSAQTPSNDAASLAKTHTEATRDVYFGSY